MVRGHTHVLSGADQPLPSAQITGTRGSLIHRHATSASARLKHPDGPGRKRYIAWRIHEPGVRRRGAPVNPAGSIWAKGALPSQAVAEKETCATSGSAADVSSGSPMRQERTLGSVRRPDAPAYRPGGLRAHLSKRQPKLNSGPAVTAGR